MTLLTQFQQRRKEKRERIYAEYRELAANPENSRSAIIQFLQNKFNIGSASTIYGIIKEMEVQNEKN